MPALIGVKMVNEQQKFLTKSSLEYPTKEYLNSNFHEADLLKRCRELGLNKVWINKDQLFDIIMANTPLANQNNDVGDEPSSDTTTLSDVTDLQPDDTQSSTQSPSHNITTPTESRIRYSMT